MKDYPIISIEDGLAEDDWEGWVLMTKRWEIEFKSWRRFTCNPKIGSKGYYDRSSKFCIGQTESDRFRNRDAGDHRCGSPCILRWLVSHRSGETEDSFIADFSVACGSGQIKTGAPCRSERWPI